MMALPDWLERQVRAAEELSKRGHKPSIEHPEHPLWREYYDVCEMCGEAYELYYLKEWGILVPSPYKEMSLCRECLKEYAPIAYEQLVRQERGI